MDDEVTPPHICCIMGARPSSYAHRDGGKGDTT